MSQTLHYWDTSGAEVRRELPDAADWVMQGVRWGNHWEIFSPAYWLSQLWMSDLELQRHSPYKARGTLTEELVFCMLGGYGITAELATAAFEACRNAGLVSHHSASEADWSAVLSTPLTVQNRKLKYRYPNQKSRFLAGAMAHISKHPICAGSGKELRNSLLDIPGVGPKTAGWIARNYLDADDVAILDIHLIRAGQLCNLFSPTFRIERDYFAMEERFIQFCGALKARPATLDCLIWDQMRACGHLAIDALSRKIADTQSSHPSLISDGCLEPA